MSKRVCATDAKNNFGGMLDDVAAFGRVDVLKHGRLVAVVLSPRELDAISRAASAQGSRQTHMIPPALARRARITREPQELDDGWNDG